LDEKGVAIYIDPPYLVKGAKYIHDFKPEDHQRLASALQRFKKARVVVSYYDDLRLDNMYPGWSQHKINVSKAMSNAGSRGKKNIRAIEVLLTNIKEGQKGLFEK
jgi:DNA adenine methylase